MLMYISICPGLPWSFRGPGISSWLRVSMRGARPELFRRAGSLTSMVGTMVIHLAVEGASGEAEVEIAALSKALAKPDTT